MESSLGTKIGWLGMGFLFGVALHSIFPYQELPALFLCFSIFLSLCLALWPTSAHRSRWIGIILIATCLGLWRFESIRLSLPSGLVPFSSQGLSHTVISAVPGSQRGIGHWLWRQRTLLHDRVNTILPHDESALLRGILYGDRDLSKEWNARFRRAGLLHIIAVSGSNITIVVVIIMSVLLGLHFSRRQAFVMLSLFLILFVLFVQPSASVIRAACMGWLLGLAPLVGRIPRPSRLLLAAAVIFTLWKPWALFYDAGFALSFLAMWGLLTWSVYFQERLTSIIPWTLLREVVSATLGASIMTMPYLAWAFGQVSLFGVVGSMLVVPFIPWMMGVGVLAILFPQISFFVLAAQGFLVGVLWVARLTDRLPFWFFPNVTLPFWMLMVSYYIIFIFWNSVQLSTQSYPQFPTPKR